MTQGIEAITVSAIGMALDAAVLRHQAIAANIANVNTEGYKPIDVNFETQLEDARLALQNQGRLDAASLANVTPRVEVRAGKGPLGLSPKVMLDVEMANLSQNAVQYQTLLKVLSRHYTIMASAVSDGKK